MANIRDQNSWVHMEEPEAATDKARDLVRMAVAKSAYLTPLKPGQMQVTPAALVIGGGLAGITAALGLAEQGFTATIVEKEPELGGNYRHLHYTLEGLDTQAHLARLIDRVERDERIAVYTGTTVAEIQGFIGNYQTTVHTADGPRQIDHGVVIVAAGGIRTESIHDGEN